MKFHIDHARRGATSFFPRLVLSNERPVKVLPAGGLPLYPFCRLLVFAPSANVSLKQYFAGSVDVGRALL